MELGVALSAIDSSCRGEVCGHILACRCSRRARSARSRATSSRADSSILAASGVSTARARTRGRGLSRKPEHLGTALPPSQCDFPGKFPIFREDSQFKLYLQRFRYTNDMERLAEGRIVAKYRPQHLRPSRRFPGIPVTLAPPGSLA